MDIYTREREHRMISGHTPARSLIAKLEKRERISPAERTALEHAVDAPVLHRAGELVLLAGVRPSDCRLLISGLAAGSRPFRAARAPSTS